MAVISKIRERLGLTIGSIAVALAIFILGGDLFLGPNSLFSGGSQTIGYIRGEKINAQEFNNELEYLKSQYQINSGKAPDENMTTALREQAWNNFLDRKSYYKEFEKLGIQVSDKELTQMVQGDSIFIHQWVRQQFTNKETNKFDKSLVLNFLQNISKMPAQNQYQWANFEDAIKKDRLKNKYLNLFQISAYATKLEIEREYNNQNSKAEIKYLHVPFAVIPDSTIQIKDEELLAYLEKNKEKYKADETRTIEYVTFEVTASAKDSSDFYQEIKTLAKNLATAENDSLFAIQHSETTPNFNFQTVKDLPSKLFDNTFIVKGGVYGPIVENKNFKIFKVMEEKEDTVYFVRASHILIPTNDREPKEKQEEARKKAEEVLNKAKAGEDFAALARVYGTDGTKEKGGDLGWYGKGTMVKPFEEATFNAKEAGLLPNLVKTEFGYHIVKITYPRTNKKFKLATIEKNLEPSDATRNEVFRKAEAFLAESPNAEKLKANLKKYPNLVLKKAERVVPNASNLNEINNAREVIRWAYNPDTKVGAVSQVFDMQTDNRFIIAILSGKTEKNEISLETHRQEAKNEVLKQKKADLILKKLTTQGTLEEIAKKYGNAAVVGNAADISMQNGTITGVGFNPIATGRVFGLKDKQRTKPFADETGVFIIELIKKLPASQIADYSQTKNQLIQNKKNSERYYVNEAIKELSDVIDYRYKFY
ncbi:MAG: peptidylprolyl isomerase [Microscillaceae bacterium]|nr:peptidylprolyl isomerase [Microscillaceae bacterium]MDW8461355.1 peptidylprolyl isomerase [Cytophagales bacterium]